MVPAPKSVCADLLRTAVPENADVVSGTENFDTAAKSVRRQTLREELNSGSRKRLKAESSQKICNKNQSVAENYFANYSR